MAIQANITSRRNFLVGCGIASAAIVTPLAVAARSPDSGTETVSAALKQAVAALANAAEASGEADLALYHAQQNVSEWDVANPEPRIPDDYEVRDGETISQAFAREQAAQGVASSEWLRQRHQVLRVNKIVKLHREAQKNQAAFVEAVKAVASVHATNLAEIVCKANASSDFDCSYFRIAHSVIGDLLDFKQAEA